MFDGKNFFDQPFKNDLRKYYSIREIAVGQVDHYTNGCLLDYNYFKYSYKMIAIDLSKQVLTIRKAFLNGSSFNISLSRIQLHKTGQSRGFLDRLLGLVLKSYILN